MINQRSTSNNDAMTSTSNSRNSNEKLPSVAKNLIRLQECEDFNLAMSLQENEFTEHYNKNRAKRQLISLDVRKGLAEEQLDYQDLLKNKAEILQRDKEFALEIQHQFEEEEQRIRLNQSQLDEQLARRLQLDESIKTNTNSGPHSSNLTNNKNHLPANDKILAGKLQDYYLNRFAKKPNETLNESTQNEVNGLMAAKHYNPTMPLRLPPPPSYTDCINSSKFAVKPLPKYTEHNNSLKSANSNKSNISVKSYEDYTNTIKFLFFGSNFSNANDNSVKNDTTNRSNH